jgi:cytochrome c2
MRAVATLGLVSIAVVAAGCGTARSPELVPNGDSSRGQRLIERYGCGSCHSIPGIERANGRIGPSLDDFRDIRTIAGEIPNNPENAIRWVRDSKKIEPGTIMPDFDMSERDARDIVAYLYSHT